MLSGVFLIKVIVGFVLYLVYTKFYTVRGEADIFKYFDDSAVVFNSLKNKPIDFLRLIFTSSPNNEYFYDNYYVKMNHWANIHNSIFYGDSIFMIKVNAFLRLFTFGSFHIQSLFFNFLSFIGLIGIYRSFKQFFAIKSRYLIIAIVGLPSVLFWSSSVLKESLLLLFIGGICFQFLKIWQNKIDIKRVFIIVFLLFLLTLLKFYIVFALIIPALAFIINMHYKVNRPTITYLVITFVFLILFFNSSLLPILVLKQHDFLTLVSNTNAGSFYEIPRLESNFVSIVKAIPQGILNTFIRPLPKQGMSLMAYPAVIENLIIIIGLLFTIPSILKPKYWERKTNSILFILFFTMLLFAVIGITTPVAGALVRYKVAALPFLSIFIFYFIEKRKSNSKI